MSITRETVEKIAALANLELNEDEKELFATQLSSIVNYIEKLNELDTKDVLPMSHSTLSGDSSYALRDDTPGTPIGEQAALANAPDASEGHFKVPKVIG